MAGERSSDAEIEIYVNQIAELLVRGIRRRDEILREVNRINNLSDEELQRMGWIRIEKKDRMIDEYVKRARDILHEINKETLQETVDIYACQLEYLYKRAVKKGKEATANKIMSNKILLKGVGKRNVLQGNFKIKDYDIELTDEEQADYDSRVNELFGLKNNEKDLKDKK